MGGPMIRTAAAIAPPALSACGTSQTALKAQLPNMAFRAAGGMGLALGHTHEDERKGIAGA